MNSLKSILKIQTLPTSQHEAYEEYLLPKKIHGLRLNSFFAVMLFMTLIVMDYWIFPSVFMEVAIVHFIAIASIVGTWIYSYSSSFAANYERFFPYSYLIPTSCIEYSIYLSKPTDIGYFILFASLAIIVIVMIAWAYVSTKITVYTTVGVVAGLIAAIVFREETSSHGLVLLLVSNVFVVFAAITTGGVGRIIQEGSNIENFSLQHSLNEAVTEKAKEVDKFEYFSNHDQLTGLSNRRYAEKNFARKLEIISELSNVTIVMFFLDLNGFKAINDNYGHDAGDEVLRVTATRLKECTPCGDNLVRLGGDEFLLCLTVDIDDNTIVDETKRKIQEFVTKPIHYKEHILKAGTSIGVARYPEDGKDLESLIKTSDEAMYKDKLSKKGMIPRKSEAQRQSA